MEISFSELLQAGVGVIALALLYVYMQSTSKDNERRDNADKFEREQRAKDNQQFMLLFATLSGKQETSTAQVIKSGVDSEGRISSHITASETNVKNRVNASGEANTAAIEKLYRLTDSAFQILLARPPDPMAAEKYDKALAILTAQVEAVKDDLAGVKTDTAANTDARVHTTEMPAVVAVPTADVPTEVVITEVSPAAVDTIVNAMGGGSSDSEEAA